MTRSHDAEKQLFKGIARLVHQYAERVRLEAHAETAEPPPSRSESFDAWSARVWPDFLPNGGGEES